MFRKKKNPSKQNKVSQGLITILPKFGTEWDGSHTDLRVGVGIPSQKEDAVVERAFPWGYVVFLSQRAEFSHFSSCIWRKKCITYQSLWKQIWIFLLC